MKDVAPELLEKIEKDFKKELKKNKLIQDLQQKVYKGKATYKEANEYAIELGEILANAYKKNLSSNVLPDGKMYYNIAKRIIEPTMTNNYDLITQVTNLVQEVLNKEANVGIKPITPEINKDRIEGIINRVSSEDEFDEVAWILDEPIKNFSQSIIDDAIKANADFHSKSGMKPKIIRKVAGNCCEWCREVAGTYSYPKVPQDVYRRHQRCRCTVDYFPGDGKVQNVHSKSWRDETKIEKRKQIGLQTIEEINATKFKRTFDAVPQSKVVDVMRKDSQKWIALLSNEEIRCIQKYTLNDVVEKPKVYERLNAMLRGSLDRDNTLDYYANTISNALKKSILGENVICYRGIDTNYLKDFKVGEYLTLDQFTSTSVKSSKMFKKPARIVIYAKKGLKGAAYIENISKMPGQRE